jgi:hypothetical protein
MLDKLTQTSDFNRYLYAHCLQVPLGNRRCVNRPFDIERMRAVRADGVSIRKLAASFRTTQWMASSRLTSAHAAVSAPLGE